MVITPTATISGAVLAKSGVGKDNNISGGLVFGSAPDQYVVDDWIQEGEAYLSNLVKFDIVANWASLNSTYRLMFTEWITRYAAIEVIKYNMNGYTSRVEAEDLINVHIFRMEQIQKLLEKASVQDFMGV